MKRKTLLLFFILSIGVVARGFAELNAEYSYWHVLEKIKEDWINIKNSKEYKNATRREKREADTYIKKLWIDILNKEIELNKMYLQIEEENIKKQQLENIKHTREKLGIFKYVIDIVRINFEFPIALQLNIISIKYKLLGNKTKSLDIDKYLKEYSENLDLRFGKNGSNN